MTQASAATAGEVPLLTAAQAGNVEYLVVDAGYYTADEPSMLALQAIASGRAVVVPAPAAPQAPRAEPEAPTCARCGKPARHNVPRIGAAGGWVHEDGSHLCTEPEQERLTKHDAEAILQVIAAHQPLTTRSLPRRAGLFALCEMLERIAAGTEPQHQWTMHEDELPPMSDEQYAKWFAASYVPDGVGCRVGPMVIAAS
jgi:hypothetical protein